MKEPRRVRKAIRFINTLDINQILDLKPGQVLTRDFNRAAYALDKFSRKELIRTGKGYVHYPTPHKQARR